MDDPAALSFGALLRRHRLAAGLSQEELAERAKLSAQAVSALERAIRRVPYRDTVDLLADALALADDERARLQAAVVRRRGPAADPPAPPDRGVMHLPVPLTSFIGREQEQATLLRLLESERLLTLTGAGGVGKTRLAARVAAAAAGRYPDGVHFVDLAPLADTALVTQAVAQALGVREAPNTPVVDTLTDVLRERSALLVLDNCEHLRAGVVSLAGRLLRCCPALRILATSREILGVMGERVWQAPPMTVPSSEFLVPSWSGSHPALGTRKSEPAALGPPRHSAQSVIHAESAQLFCARAAAAQPAFAITDANAPAVAAICRRLDGIPLAIELAAARTRVLTPEQIAARLDARFQFLTSGADGVPPRHQTLRAALDWSHDLLADPERALLRRLSVFVGGCEIEAAEDVCDDTDLLDLLNGLVEKSLVVVEYRGAAARYRLLETVRGYALERLDASGEGEAIRRRHVEWALGLAEELSPSLSGSDQVASLERLDVEHDNFRAALSWSLGAEDAATALRLAIALQPLWRVRTYFDEGRGWFARVLACAGDPPPALRAEAFRAAAALAYKAGDPDAMGALAREGFAVSRELADRRGMALTLHQMGAAAWERRDVERARAAWEESFALMRELGDQAGLSASLGGLGTLAGFDGDYARAAALYEQSLAIERSFGNKRQIAHNLRVLGGARLELREHARARLCATEGLTLAEELADPWTAAGMLRLLAHVAVAEGDLAHALALHERGLARHREAGNAWSIAEGLYYLARALLRHGDVTRARPLLDECLALGRRLQYRGVILEALRALGDAARLEGDLDRSEAFLLESVEESRASGNLKELPTTLESMAFTAAAAGRPERAARLLGAARAVRDAIGATVRPYADPPIDEWVGGLRAALSADTFAATSADGVAMSPEEAIAYALADRGDRRPTQTPLRVVPKAS